MYTLHEELLTAEEIEDVNHDPSTEEIPTLTPDLREWLLGMELMGRSPEASTRRKFEERPAALGVSPELLLELRSHNLLLPPVQQRSLLSLVRSTMLRHLIPCSGARTLEEHVQILVSILYHWGPEKKACLRQNLTAFGFVTSNSISRLRFF